CDGIPEYAFTSFSRISSTLLTEMVEIEFDPLIEDHMILLNDHLIQALVETLGLKRPKHYNL
ncbi:hypothetical protein Tco_0029630, partial [Tanacetum coccineum]